MVRIENGWRLVTEKGVAIGDIATTDNVLRKLVIDPQYRGQGYGTAAFDAWLEHCRTRGYDEAYVAMVVNDFMAAIVIEADCKYEEVDDEALPITQAEYDETGDENPNFRLKL